MTTTSHSRNVRKVAKNDFEITVDGQVIGYAASMIEAIERADAHILALVEFEARTVDAEPVTVETVTAPVAPVGLAGITRENVAAVVEKAKAAVADQTRWLNTLRRAQEVLEQGRWIFDGHTLRIHSRTRGKVYTVSGNNCRCEAGANGQPCHHVSAWRILKLAAAQPAA